MKRPHGKLLTSDQVDELTALAEMPDEAIDTSDIPEVRDWNGARRGLFYRAVKHQLTLRLDADTVAWFKAHATPDEGYQTRINRVLRDFVRDQIKNQATPRGSSSDASIEGDRIP